MFTMSFDVGTSIDISHVNKKREAAPLRHKKSFPEATRKAYEVGTQIVFNFTPTGFKAAIRIPVAFA
jgi:hypothetical protein